VAIGTPIIAGNTIAGNLAIAPRSGGSTPSYGAGGGIFSLNVDSSPQIIATSSRHTASGEQGAAEPSGCAGAGHGHQPQRPLRQPLLGQRGWHHRYSQARIEGNLIDGNSAASTAGASTCSAPTPSSRSTTLVGNALTETAIGSGYTYSGTGPGSIP